MKVDVTLEEGGGLVLKEIYSGVLLETSEGNRLGICMRDDTFEINIIPHGTPLEKHNWWRVNMQDGTIEKEVANVSTGGVKTESCSGTGNVPTVLSTRNGGRK